VSDFASLVRFVAFGLRLCCTGWLCVYDLCLQGLHHWRFYYIAERGYLSASVSGPDEIENKHFIICLQLHIFSSGCHVDQSGQRVRTFCTFGPYNGCSRKHLLECSCVSGVGHCLFDYSLSGHLCIDRHAPTRPYMQRAPVDANCRDATSGQLFFSASLALWVKGTSRKRCQTEPVSLSS
jgi:hypothetical protein